MHKYLLIALGGALGAMFRYWVGITVTSRLGTRFPWGTLVINLSACAVIGFTLTLITRRSEMSTGWLYFAGIGFIGSYSTFSTYEWETLSLIQAGSFPFAALYSLGSLTLGLAAAWCGMAAADLLP